MIKLSREFKTGLIAVLTIILFIWGFSFIKNDNIFKKERIFYAVYKNVQGLEPSSLVTINGFKVGKIDNISFHPQKKGYLIVKFSLNTDFQFSKKSIAKIYSSDLIGSKSLSVIPNYKGILAVDGDTLKSEIEPGVFELLNDKVAPLQSKFESLLIHTDSTMQSLNNILDTNTVNNIKKAIKSFKNNLLVFEQTSKVIDSMIKGSQTDFNEILNNSKSISQNLKQFTDSLNRVEIIATFTKLQSTLDTFDAMLSDIQSGKGSVGKLLKDEKLYQNFTNASKELEELLRDMKLHPKRFVHFSLFGKKAKAYKATSKDSLK
jgi:phospholipid/cholesterol/gamma-HCH transport system substrate-binding protein